MQETQEIWVRSLSWEDSLEQETATHSSILAWEILLTEEPGRLQSMELQRVGHDRATKHTCKVTVPEGPVFLEYQGSQSAEGN